MQFRLTINLGDDTMLTPADIAVALTDLAVRLSQRTAGDPHEPITMTESTTINGNVWDINGNHVGGWDVVK